MSYAAISNYGDVAEQALEDFSAGTAGECGIAGLVATRGKWRWPGPKIEESLEKIARLQQYIGDEIVVSGSFEGSDPKMLMIAEIRKPGLKKFLEELIIEAGGETKAGRTHIRPTGTRVCEGRGQGAETNCIG